MSDYTPATKTVRDNYRIVVEADEDRWIRQDADPHRRKLAQLEAIKREIVRHVDDINSVAVSFDSIAVCAYCEHRWDWCIDDDGNPACCDEAVKDWENQTGSKYA